MAGVFVLEPCREPRKVVVHHKCSYRPQCAEKQCNLNGKQTTIESMTITQFPLVAEKAQTIHKAQGQTYKDGITIASLNGRNCPSETLYLALSRAPTSADAFSLVKLAGTI